MNRFSTAVAVAALALLSFIGTACKQGLNQRCEITSDCEDGLVCSVEGAASGGGTCMSSMSPTIDASVTGSGGSGGTGGAAGGAGGAGGTGGSGGAGGAGGSGGGAAGAGGAGGAGGGAAGSGGAGGDTDASTTSDSAAD